MLSTPRTAPVCRGGRNDIRDRDSAIARTGPADQPLAINATRARLTVSKSKHEPAASGEEGVDRPPRDSQTVMLDDQGAVPWRTVHWAPCCGGALASHRSWRQRRGRMPRYLG